MEEFLKSELAELPPGVRRAVLKQLENSIRACRATIYHDKSEDTSLRCITIVARIANAIDLAASMRSVIHSTQE